MNGKCELCGKRPATVHLTEILESQEKRERHLCEECAIKEGVIIKQHHTTNEILQQFIKQKTGLGGADELTCPKCGVSFREFQTRGQLGCANDYVAFQSVLMPLIERAHEGATHHVGKVPVTADETLRRQAGLVRLRRELQEALDHEDYENAARLRDQLRHLETP